MLLRRHVGRLLSDYYAQPSHKVVGATTSQGGGDINFASLLGEWHWKWLYRRAYRRQEGQWLTPVELFRPHYSRTVAEFVARTVREQIGRDDTSGDGGGGAGAAAINGPIDVVELGGGRGTNASIVLSHLRAAHPDVYDAVRYTLIDSSPTLHALQGEVLLGEKSEHADKVTLLRRDAADIAEGREDLLGESDAPTVAIALELLDNLPHDKVAKDRTSRDISQAEVSEWEGDEGPVGRDAPVGVGSDKTSAEEDVEKESCLMEAFVPLSDPLLASVLDAVPSYAGRSASWVPTTACGLIRRLFTERPNSGLLMIDFDWLPPPDLDPRNHRAEGEGAAPGRRRSVEAVGEPLITDMTDRDHECYLTAPRHCDILFPTDFDKLALFVERIGEESGVGNTNARAMKQFEFLMEYGGEEVEGTRSRWTGYSPLLHDFSNYSVLAVTPGKASNAPKDTGISFKPKVREQGTKARMRKR